MHPLIEKYNALNHFGRHHFHLLSAENGRCHYQMRVKPEHLALPVSVHGGMLAALMDACTGVAALSLSAIDGKFLNTLELKVQYVSPARPNTLLDAHGTVTFAGGSIYYAEGKITCEGSLIALSTATFKSYPAAKIPVTPKV
ncbi:MAG: PaaI family thioesterase [Flavobacteriales bacterium]|jgi:uncharacterized protein (TIGR00369 family)|nr:PaaI family thioesterase [Flavobacteriales bacterium]